MADATMVYLPLLPAVTPLLHKEKAIVERNATLPWYYGLWPMAYGLWPMAYGAPRGGVSSATRALRCRV
eukprot:2785103-Prymnesium_polylepis.1